MKFVLFQPVLKSARYINQDSGGETFNASVDMNENEVEVGCECDACLLEQADTGNTDVPAHHVLDIRNYMRQSVLEVGSE